MSIAEKLRLIVDRIPGLRETGLAEEATKTALTMPMLQALGYDVFNPAEVCPEFTADVGIKKGEKVDYAILRDGQPVILIECKPLGASLDNYSSQLFRYFNTLSSRLAIITDGAVLRLYSDLSQPNRMDETPFMEIHLEALDEAAIAELTRISKPEFDIDAILAAAGRLKMLRAVSVRLKQEFSDPSDAFVRAIADPVHDGRMTQGVLDTYRSVLKTCLTQHVRDLVDARLRAALSRDEEAAQAQTDESDDDGSEDNKGIETTVEELEGYYAVKAILREQIDASRIVYRDSKSYMAILLDDNNRKPICRLRFNSSKKYVGVFDAEKKETKHLVEGPDGLFQIADEIRKSLGHRLGE